MTGESHKQAVKKQFAKTAQEYSQWATVDAGRAKSDVAFFLPSETDRTLDVACGPGTLSLKLAALTREVVGIDLTNELLAIAASKAREQGLTNVTFTPGDVEDLPYSAETFDLVVCGSALHHFPDPRKVFQEMGRVCKPGGRVGVIDIVSPEEPDRAALTLEIRRLRDPSHARALKASEILTLFREAGLLSLRHKAEFRSERFRSWARTGGIEEADPRYARLWSLYEGAIEGDGTGWNIRRVPGDLEFDRSYFYACGVKAP
ncbi:MAG: methyltransferase domain-containing protein [Deferrisomatales bacterium]|nr:methyltransferase domain-containing protein [Deferrisomatales bacterium]